MITESWRPVGVKFKLVLGTGVLDGARFYTETRDMRDQKYSSLFNLNHWNGLAKSHTKQSEKRFIFVCSDVL